MLIDMEGNVTFLERESRQVRRKVIKKTIEPEPSATTEEADKAER